MIQPFPLLDDYVYSAPMTEGVKYIGSKTKMIPYILHLVKKTGAKTVLDGFSGTSRVSQALAKSGYRVICNDIATWSDVFATCYLLNRSGQSYYQDLISHLNAVPARDGWFTEFYGGYANAGCSIQQDGLKRPWQIHNTRKLDAIREEIERLKLEKSDKAVALTSLILALDQVDNTLGHFASYLREWSPRSYRECTLNVPALFTISEDHQVHRADIFEVLSSVSADVAYFDPPYGSKNDKMPPSRVRYSSYYHIWTSICLFDKPDLFGKVRRRTDTTDKLASSVFEEFRRDREGRFIATVAIERLISNCKTRWVILSYSSDGRATAEEIRDVISRSGRLIEVIELEHKKNVMSSMRWTNEWLDNIERPNREFLFLIEKNLS